MEASPLFPFADIRSGQRDFLEDVSHALESGSHLIAHAPTGIGKTVAVLAPALAYAREHQKTLFFLTPKHTQHVIVVDTLARIQRKFDVSLSVVDIVGKQWMCLHGVADLDSREFHEFCRRQKKDEICQYYNRLRRAGKPTKAFNEAVAALRKEPLHNEKILSLCTEKRLCPYEVCIEAGKKADIVIGDYFHLVTPAIREAFLHRLGKELEDIILVVDEAHNLPERIRSIMSVTLSEYSLKRAIHEAKALGYHTLAEEYALVQKTVRKSGKGLVHGAEKLLEKDTFISAVSEATGLSVDELVDASDDLAEEVLSLPNRYRSYAKAVGGFLESWTGPDLGYARILRRDDAYSLSHKCLDPSLISKELFENVHSAILMSGTLHPLDMYADVLGFPEKRTLLQAYPSPFPAENRLLLLVPGLTTKYAKRSDYMYRKYAATIGRILAATPGNVAVFFPSYALLKTIYGHLSSGIARTGKEPLLERSGMKKHDRRVLHQRLADLQTTDGGVLFAVQAGSMSEGVDYADNLLSAVVIVGLPLERPDLLTQSLIDYYDFKFERGWDYGYIYPAMNRALQAAGRGIRSETDKGAIVLLDDRFRWRNYAKCLPSDFEAIATEHPERYLARFFAGPPVADSQP